MPGDLEILDDIVVVVARIDVDPVEAGGSEFTDRIPGIIPVELDTIFPDFICEPLGNGLESQVVRAGKRRCPEVDEMEGARVISVENGGREVAAAEENDGPASPVGGKLAQRGQVEINVGGAR